MINKFDAIIIGFGKAGKTLAVDLANRGQKIALIEKSQEMYGGTCINQACIPTKILENKSSIIRNQNLDSFNEKEIKYEELLKELSDEERKELIELRKRNKELEMEVDLLKKLKALIQQREKK